MMKLFPHVDDPSILSELLSDCTDTLRGTETNDVEGQQTPANSESPEDMADWFASDEAAFWMSM